jgi:hypothetical protein
VVALVRALVIIAGFYTAGLVLGSQQSSEAHLTGGMFQNSYSGLCMDVADWSKANGATVWQHYCHGRL